MKTFIFTLLMLPLLAYGGDTNSQAFIQGSIKIVPPIQHAQIYAACNDGGTIRADITAADGKIFIVYIDKRVMLGGNKTRGDVYLNAYPSETNSVHVLNQLEFRQKIGDFDKSGTNSF
jgi:hypothetical protein